MTARKKVLRNTCAPVEARHLSAEGGGSLLAAALPGAVGAVDVVEARDAALHAKVFVVVHAQLLRGQLLQTICILGLRTTIASFSIQI